MLRCFVSAIVLALVLLPGAEVPSIMAHGKPAYMASLTLSPASLRQLQSYVATQPKQIAGLGAVTAMRLASTGDHDREWLLCVELSRGSFGRLLAVRFVAAEEAHVLTVTAGKGLHPVNHTRLYALVTVSPDQAL